MRIEAAELQAFLDEVRTRYGLVFDPSRYEELRELIRERIRAIGLGTFADYLAALKSSEPEWQEVVNRLTVPETYFFRIPEQFDAFSALVLPRLLERRAPARRLRLASLGCASGEEPYTMAMIIRAKFPGLESWDIDITGFDVSQKALDRASRGVYTNWALRGTPDEMRKQFFRQTRNGWELDQRIRSMVQFQARNILQMNHDTTYDVVFFRNVLIYFSPESTRAAIARASHLTGAGGYLFIGPAESLRGITNAFSLRHSHGAFYYEREAGDVDRRSVDARTPAARPVPSKQPKVDRVERVNIVLPQISTAWVDEIERSGLRISELASSGRSALPIRENARMVALHTAMAMFASEKYAAALKELDSIPEKESDPDVQILRAVILINSGKVDEAEAAAQATLKHDHLNPGAHYVLALCDEQKQDLASALEHDVMAGYLDPGFAMPHVHAATIHRRRNSVNAACDEMERALSLLASEDAARILLFGGGFSREALQSYCEREMNRCRGGN